MENEFSNKFKELRLNRNLSIKEVSLLTGVPLKEVKQWERGQKVPNTSRVMHALEGLLGEEINKELPLIEDPLKTKQVEEQTDFIFDEIRYKERKNRINRIKDKVVKPRQTNSVTSPTNFIKIKPSEESTPEDTSTIETNDFDLSFDEDYIERPYIYDPNQIAFYWTRNGKTIIILLLLLIIAARSFSLFWSNLTLFLSLIHI